MVWFENRGFGSSQYPYAKKKPQQTVIDETAGEQGPLGPLADYVVGPRSATVAATDPYNERRELAKKSITPVQASVSTQDDSPGSGAVKGAALGAVAGSVPVAVANDLEVQKARYRHLNEQFNLGTAANIRSRHIGKGDAVTDLESIRSERDAIGRMLGSRANAADLAARSQITPEQRMQKSRDMDYALADNLLREKKAGYAQPKDAEKTRDAVARYADENRTMAADATNYPARIAGQDTRAKFWGDESMKIRGERDTAVADRTRATDLAKQTGFAAMERGLEGVKKDPIQSAVERLNVSRAERAITTEDRAVRMSEIGVNGPEDLKSIEDSILSKIGIAVDASVGTGAEDAMSVLENEDLPKLAEIAAVNPEWAKTVARKIRSQIALSKNGFWNAVGQFAEKVVPDFLENSFASTTGHPIIGQAARTHQKNVNIEKLLRAIEGR